MKPSLRKTGILIAGLILPAGFTQAAVQFFNPRVPSNIPNAISQTGIYTNIVNKEADTALKYYEVNAPLWSDGAEKKRWIILKPGRKIVYQDTVDLFTYPDSSIFVKNFSLRTVDADPATEVLWETRLLVNKNDSDGHNHWYGFSYKWNAGATEAVLINTLPGFNALTGFDTTFVYFPGGTSRPQSYKKWRFPSPTGCNECHPATLDAEATVTSRGVAGFFPVQLKRPAPLDPSINQVEWLFNQGVFMGSPPEGPALARRWKRLTETIPSGPEDLRFRVIDTMARSYLGANCTACHGRRGIEASNTAPNDLNYDWWDFTPRIEFGTFASSSLGLNDPQDSSLERVQPGPYKYRFMAVKVGLDTSAGAVWHMPPPDVNALVPFISQGHPELSALLYRQLGARNAPWIDSVEMRRSLVITGDPQNYGEWIFSDPWGSAPWRSALGAHGVTLNSVISYSPDPMQMPRVATYIPDTSAMRVLGEWAKTYRTLVRVPGQDSIVNVRGRLVRVPASGARIRNRMLIVPEGWTGRAVMSNIQGRVYPLATAGAGRYALPAYAPAGVYIFKVGSRSFRAFISGN